MLSSSSSKNLSYSFFRRVSQNGLGTSRFLFFSSVILVVILGTYTFSTHLFCVLKYAEQAQTAKAFLPINVPLDEAIVVLTGDARRIPKALELLRFRKSPMLIISGAGKGASLTEVINQQGNSSLLIHESWDRITLEKTSTSTIQNAYESGKLLRSKNISQVILVTSEYHMDRSLRIFKKVLPEINFLAYPVISDVSRMSLLDPNKKLLSGSYFFLTEWGKRILFEGFYQFRTTRLN